MVASLAFMGRTIRATLDGAPESARHLRAAREGLLDVVAQRNRIRTDAWLRHTGRRLRWALAAAGAAGLAAALVLASGRPVRFHVGGVGVEGKTGDVIEAGSAPLALSFSEGSSVVVREGARLRVLASEATGARVLVEAGDVDVAIVHRKVRKTSWRFELGPFRVLVTGTKFRAGWSPTTETLTLSMHEGSVVVSGRCIETPRVVVAGEMLNMSCLPALSRPRPVVPAPGAAGGELRPAETAPAVLEPRPPSAASWRALLARGQLRDAFRAADGEGFERACRTATSRELLGLSGAARLAGRAHRATEALGILRERFPHTPDASSAAFALGRIAFDQRRAYGSAARWFATYLEEQPDGALMGDAIGRLMEARHRAGDVRRAQADAERYLGRFPEGPYAHEARELLARR